MTVKMMAVVCIPAEIQVQKHFGMKTHRINKQKKKTLPWERRDCWVPVSSLLMVSQTLYLMLFQPCHLNGLLCCGFLAQW